MRGVVIRRSRLVWATYWEGVERSLGEHSLEGNTQNKVLQLNTTDILQITQGIHRCTIDRQRDIARKTFLLLLCITKVRIIFTGFPCPYIRHGQLCLCVNRFLSLTPSHYDLTSYVFTPALPFFPLCVTPHLFKLGLSVSLVRSCFIIGGGQ